MGGAGGMWEAKWRYEVRGTKYEVAEPGRAVWGKRR